MHLTGQRYSQHCSSSNLSGSRLQLATKHRNCCQRRSIAARAKQSQNVAEAQMDGLVQGGIVWASQHGLVGEVGLKTWLCEICCNP
jgi:hypothetical protein